MAGLQTHVQQSALGNGFVSVAQCLADRTSRVKIPSPKRNPGSPAAAGHSKVQLPSRYHKIDSTAQHQCRHAHTVDVQELPEDMRYPRKYHLHNWWQMRDRKCMHTTGTGVHRNLATASIRFRTCSNKPGMLNTIARAMLAAIRSTFCSTQGMQARLA